MQIINNKYFGFFLTVLILFTFLNIFYSKILYSPNDYMFSNSGDGLKNYFSFKYHIDNDSTYMNSNAMNYPYGELITFMDGQPVVTNTIKAISSIFPKITNYSVGIINFMMIISFLFCGIFLYLIFQIYKINPMFSAVAAAAIAL